MTLDGDAFDLDNRRAFAFRMPGTVPVLVVGKSRKDIFPITAALASETGRPGVFDVDQSSSGEAWADRLPGRKVLILANVPRLSGPDTEKLDGFLGRGGSLFLIFGKDVQPESDATLAIAGRFGIRFGSAMGRGGSLTLGAVDYSHPIFEGIFEKGKEKIRSPQFFKTVPTEGRALRVVIALNNGQPLLSEARSDRGSLIVFSSGLEDDWSDFTLSTIFAPLMVRSVLYLASPHSGESPECAVGEPIRVQVGNDSLKSGWTVVTPSGDSVNLLPRILGREVGLSFDGTDTPGLYRFLRNGTLIDMRAVHVDPLESDFRTVSDQRLKTLFPRGRIRTIGEDERIEHAVQEGRTGRELWKGFLLAALGLLVLESFLADGWKEK
jgi:hypothetical protein